MIPAQTQTPTTEINQATFDQPSRINRRSVVAVGAAAAAVAGGGAAMHAAMEAATPNVPMIRPDAQVMVTDGIVHELPSNPSDLRITLDGAQVIVNPQTTPTTEQAPAQD